MSTLDLLISEFKSRQIHERLSCLCEKLIGVLWLGRVGDMPTCYRCGSHIPAPGPNKRRRVKTGEWIRRQTPGSKVTAMQTHFGLRIVCADCALKLDQDMAKLELKRLIQLVVALGFLFLLLALGVLHS